MKRFFVFVAMALVLATAGCAGKNYVAKPVILDDGTRIIQGGRTGVFGTDNSWVRVDPPPAPPLSAPEPVEPRVVQLFSIYTWSRDRWVAKCPEAQSNPKQRKNWEHAEGEEKETRQVIAYPILPSQPTAPMPQPTWGFVGNPSAGNWLAPAAIGAAGFAVGMGIRRPDQTNITQSGGGATAAGGNASARATSRSRATARQWQDQGQSQDTDVSIDD